MAQDKRIMYSLGGGIRLRHLRSLRAAFARQSFLTLAKKPSFNLWKFSGIPNFPKLPPLLLMSLLTRCYTRPGYMYRNRRTVDEEEEGEDDKAVGRGRSFFFFCESLLQGWRNGGGCCKTGHLCSRGSLRFWIWSLNRFSNK